MYQKNLMRTLTVALAALLTATLPASTVGPGDIDAESPLVDALMADGMTRAELSSLYAELAGGEDQPPDCISGQEMFDDVLASNPFCRWIQDLARRGITAGCDADSYCPASPVTRAQMAVFIVRALQTPEVLYSGTYSTNILVDDSVNVPVAEDGSIVALVSVPTTGTYLVTFSAECAVSAPAGNHSDWLDVDIIVAGQVLPPTVGDADVFCSANGTSVLDGFVRASITVPVTLEPGSLYPVAVQAHVTNPAATLGSVGNVAIVVHR